MPSLIRRIFKIVPEKTWRRRAESLREKARQNPYMSEYLNEIHELELTLDSVMKNVEETGILPTVSTSASHYRLYAFIATFARMREKLGKQERVRLDGMLKDGVKNKNGLTSLQHELTTFIGLQTKALDVVCHDIVEGAGYDYYVRAEGLELEVECKCAGGDLGRKVEREHALSTFNKLESVIREHWRTSTEKRGIFVDVVYEGRSTADLNTLNKIAAATATAISSGDAQESDGVSIAASEFTFAGSIFDRGADARPSRNDLEEFCRNEFDIKGVYTFVLGSEPNGCVIVCLRSKKPDRFLDALLRTCKEAARDQFSETKAAVLSVQLLDMTAEQIAELTDSRSDPENINGLMRIAHEFFKSESRRHVFAIIFRSHGIIQNRVGSDGIEGIQEEGLHYIFKNSQHWASSRDDYPQYHSAFG